MIATFVNLCRRPITIISQDGERITLEAAANPAYVKASRRRVELSVLNGDNEAIVEMIQTTTHGAANVPDEEDGVFYIVSSAVAAELSHRADLLITGGLVRDEKGRVTSATAVIQTTPKGANRNGSAA